MSQQEIIITQNLREQPSDIQYGEGVHSKIRIDHLKVDFNTSGGYQRSIHESRVRNIKHNYDESCFSPIMIALREDGSMYVYDGATRLNVAKALGLKFVAGKITKSKGREQEAMWFAKINSSGKSGSKRVDQYDKHKAELVAKDKHALLAQNFLDAYGLEVSRTGTKTRATNGIGTIKKYMKQNYERMMKAGHLIYRLWRDEDAAWSSTMIRGMYELCGLDLFLVVKIEEGLKNRNITPRDCLEWASALQQESGLGGGGSAYIKKSIIQKSGVTLKQLKKSDEKFSQAIAA